MSTILNALYGASQYGNSGVDTPQLDLKNIQGLIILPSGYKFLATTLLTSAAFLTAVQAATLAAANVRAFPVFNLVSEASATEASVIETYKNGSRGKVRDGYIDDTYLFTKGGMGLWTSLKGFENAAVDVLFVDVAGTVFGQKNSDGSLSGAPLEFMELPTLKFSDGSAKTHYLIHIVANPAFLTSFGFVEMSASDLRQIKGLNNVTLTQNGARTGGAVIVNATIGFGGTNLHDSYATGFAAPSLWKAKDAVTGNAVAVLTAADAPSQFGWTITVDITDPNYNAGNKLLIYFSLPSIVNTAIAGLFVESNVLTTLT